MNNTTISNTQIQVLPKTMIYRATGINPIKHIV